MKEYHRVRRPGRMRASHAPSVTVVPVWSPAAEQYFDRQNARAAECNALWDIIKFVFLAAPLFVVGFIVVCGGWVAVQEDTSNTGVAIVWVGIAVMFAAVRLGRRFLRS